MASISQASVFCLCAVLVSLAQANDQITETETSGPLFDIREFFSSNLELWVYNSTEETKGEPLCRYDANYNITGNSTFFKRYSGKTQSVDSPQPTLLKGNFLNWNDNKTILFDSLELYKEGTPETFNSYEVYEYAGNNLQCAVVSALKFGSSMDPSETKMIHELRLNGSALKTPEIDPECWKIFNFILKDLKRTTKSSYSPTCKEKLL
uniref:Lipocalin/cytosolic fatty-acid binding domain-containing protein n=1 Tax=Amblyomma maculatum TaxID=34609 RepID=G3MNK9_AMBMU